MNFSKARSRQRSLLAGSATLALVAAASAVPAHAVVPNENTDSEEIVDDEEEFEGVGQFFRNDGFVCTGSLINPRTVLFAAHCVNDRPETDYATDGLVQSAFSFNFDALPGFIDWINNGFASNPELEVFNVSRIFYNPASLENPAALGFIEADIALATLDTPAANLPTWALLFSPLPDPGAIDPVNGTGYHVNITGFGATGNATEGAVDGVDFRRRAAENMLGGLNSLDDRNNFLFGPADPLLPQNLYTLDFDDPNGESPFDFNVYRDDALPNEGTTAGGDSGGPLILDAANNSLSTEDLVIGVLSGGSRFFGPQPFSSYGTTSFYQPLFLHWDYIAATNPYRYVTAKAGDGNWEDATHWETTLDPVYRIIDESGAVVNGLPTTLGAGRFGTDPDFGAVCFDPVGDNPGDECQDLNTGEITDGTRVEGGIQITSGRGFVGTDLSGGSETNNIGDLTVGGAAPVAASVAGATETSNIGEISIELANNAAQVDLAEATASQTVGPEFAEEAPQGPSGGSPAFSDTPLPPPTLANGLPGASDFVPDNVDAIVSADPDVNVDPRYFDVTLGNDGTTTLSSAVTIDRLTIRNAAGLNIAAPVVPAEGDTETEASDGGDLTVLIDINQFGGTVNVDGQLTSTGDYSLFGGILSGTGTVTTPFLTNLVGAISPGGAGEIGTLTIEGNAILSSGSTLMIDLGPNGTSDLLAVTGEANVGGTVMIGTGVVNLVNDLGQPFTIVTAEGGVTGEFEENNISAILSQSFTYEENAVLLDILIGSYTDAIDPNDPQQAAYAQLFDQNRGNEALADIFALDFVDAATIQSTFRGLAPVTEQAVRSLTAMSINTMQNFNAGRLRQADRSTAGGTIAKVGSPLQAAQIGLAPSGQPINPAAMALQGGNDETEVTETNLPEDVAIFVAGGLISGDADSLPGFGPDETDVSGYYIAGGVEYYPSDNLMLGISTYYSALDADVALGQDAEADTWGGSIYGRYQTASGFILDGQFSLASLDLDTERTVDLLGNTQFLESSSDDTLFSGALAGSYDIETGIGTFSPGIEGRYARASLDDIQETGGTLALQVERESFESIQGRAGFDFEKKGSVTQLNINAQFVHEFDDGPQLLSAQFTQGTGPNANFVIGDADQNWVELGISARMGDGPLTFGLGFDTTVGRDSANAYAFSSSLNYRF